MTRNFTPEGSGGIHRPGADELTEKTGLSPFELALAAARRARDLNDSCVLTADGAEVYTETVLTKPASRQPVTLALQELDTGLVHVTRTPEQTAPKPDSPGANASTLTT